MQDIVDIAWSIGLMLICGVSAWEAFKGTARPRQRFATVWFLSVMSTLFAACVALRIAVIVVEH